MDLIKGFVTAEDYVELCFVFIGSKFYVDFFPLSLLGYFLNGKCLILLKLFLKLFMIIKLQFIVEVVDFRINF